jgi:hypothetical protein
MQLVSMAPLVAEDPNATFRLTVARIDIQLRSNLNHTIYFILFFYLTTISNHKTSLHRLLRANALSLLAADLEASSDASLVYLIECPSSF